MFRHLLLASVGAIALAGTAFAADLPSRAPPPVYVPPAPLFTWTGIYIGGQIGYAWGSQNVNFGDAFGNFNAFSYQASGVIGGAHVGYNMQFSQFVVGLEGSVDGSSISKSALIGPFGFNASNDVQGSIRGRLGFALGGLGWDRALLYGTGGVAFAGTKLSVSTPFSYDSNNNTRVGFTVGGGLEYAVTNNWSVRVEYRYSDFGHATLYPSNLGALDAGFFVNRHLTQNLVQAGFSYKFDTFAPPAPVVAKY